MRILSIAGVFGGLTAKTTILFTQALPGLLALVCVLLASPVRRDPIAGRR